MHTCLQLPSKPPNFIAATLELGVQVSLKIRVGERQHVAGTAQHLMPDDSFSRNNVYFFKDGNVTFLVDGMLYCVHRYFFSRDSVYFSTRFAQLGIRDHEALPTIISIGDIELNDFEAFLSILYPTNFEANELTYKQWKSVLHLSTRWGFASLRKLALKYITPPTPHDQLVLARTYSVDQWVLPALTALCKRILPLSLDEARQMSMEDVILVATVREEIRGGALRVDAADISRHVEVAQAGKLNPLMGNDVSWDGPKCGTTWQESNSKMTSGVNPNVNVGGARTIEVVSPPGDKFADSARASSKVEFTQAHETVPTEVVADYRLSKDPDPAPSPAPADLLLPTASVSGQRPTPEKDTVSKEHNCTPELAASAPVDPSSRPEAINIKPDGTATEPALQSNQDSELGDQRRTTPKGVAPSSLLHEETQLALIYKAGWDKEERAGRRARMVEKKSPCPSSEATSVSVVQEPKPITIAPVDIFVGMGEGVLKNCSDDDAPVIILKPDAADDDDWWD